MKKLISLLLLTFTSTYLGCSETPSPNDNANNQLTLVEIRKEPKVKEAILTEDNVIYVSVEDDGTLRNGYAQYLCNLLAENKSTAQSVKVVKINSSPDDISHGVLLGESNCEF